MHVQSENGNVMIKRRPAKHVRTNAQNPGPSGSAENKIQKKRVLQFRSNNDTT